MFVQVEPDKTLQCLPSLTAARCCQEVGKLPRRRRYVGDLPIAPNGDAPLKPDTTGSCRLLRQNSASGIIAPGGGTMMGMGRLPSTRTTRGGASAAGGVAGAGGATETRDVMELCADCAECAASQFLNVGTSAPERAAPAGCSAMPPFATCGNALPSGDERPLDCAEGRSLRSVSGGAEPPRVASAAALAAAEAAASAASCRCCCNWKCLRARTAHES